MSITAEIARIREEMHAACRRAGRNENEVALMAVSKVHPVEAILEAYASGQRLFGENRVQEWQQKAPSAVACAGLEMHLIGPLQSNKTAKAAELFTSVDTVDSAKIAQRLHAAAEALGKTLPVMIEVKLSHEESKHGIAPEELGALLEAIKPLDRIIPRGLMTVPPWSEDAETARPYFRELRRLREEHVQQCSTLVELSMGMSNDFRVAIEEGSTCIRVGTAIFGKRQYPAP
ncbi:MAG TPA: YggS family pyridoxal phosphate-dependent enzyme [Granulicella sp.]